MTNTTNPSQVGFDADGWDSETFGGITGEIENLNAIALEINNYRRGAVSGCESAEELLSDLEEYAEQLLKKIHQTDEELER